MNTEPLFALIAEQKQELQRVRWQRNKQRARAEHWKRKWQQTQALRDENNWLRCRLVALGSRLK